MKKTIGGDRLGAGNKNKVDLKSYNRSTHDRGYIWRSTMASGVLVPFMSELALPGSSFDIDLNCEVLTQPTVGPLFGSYKVQLDVFKVPIRLYQAALHMNKIGIGMNMGEIKLPQIEMTADNPENKQNLDNAQINASALYSYLNIRGLGIEDDEEEQTGTVLRRFNAVPKLAYWDIFKNYYANKQEEEAYVIHNPLVGSTNSVTRAELTQDFVTTNIQTNTATFDTWALFEPVLRIGMTGGEDNFDPARVIIEINDADVQGSDAWATWTWSEVQNNWIATGWLNPSNQQAGSDYEVSLAQYNTNIINLDDVEPELKSFPLKNIDKMREQLLQAPQDGTAYIINDEEIAPYGLDLISATYDEKNYYSKQSRMEGLAVKTYQSDLFNNWVSTEWIDGENGINDITAVKITDDEFTIDALNLNNKIYNMLMRIGVSGGSYEDWQEAVYSHEGMRKAESPVYQGGLIRELSFQEVISNSQSEEQPLGTLAGRGQMTDKRKGGKIKVKVDEASYIIGIVSLTPRIDYSQGNKWDVNLKTMDDFHKPALDGIGFQDLITDQMAWWDTKIQTTLPEYQEPIYKSAGKQPAWINYMTNVNQVRGNFAEQLNQMFMIQNRRYEPNMNADEDGVSVSIRDLTTYIDPSKFNYIFAQTRRDAQNFWTQIKVDIEARQVMSAKVMPNL